MRKRDRLREKRNRMWEKMDERKAQRKAEGGLCMIIAMVFVLGGLHFCAPDLSDAKSSRSSSSGSKSRTVSLSKKKTTTVAVTTGAVVATSQQSKAHKAPANAKRPMKKGMYYKGNMVCKKDKYTGREKCKSKSAYFFDDVLDADDWFEDDDDGYQPQQQYNTQPSQTNAADVAIVAMWLWFMAFVVVAALIVLFFMSRRK